VGWCGLKLCEDVARSFQVRSTATWALTRRWVMAKARRSLSTRGPSVVSVLASGCLRAVHGAERGEATRAIVAYSMSGVAPKDMLRARYPR